MEFSREGSDRTNFDNSPGMELWGSSKFILSFPVTARLLFLTVIIRVLIFKASEGLGKKWLGIGQVKMLWKSLFLLICSHFSWITPSWTAIRLWFNCQNSEKVNFNFFFLPGFNFFSGGEELQRSLFHYFCSWHAVLILNCVYR